MAGVVVNGERPLDLAAERDPRVRIEGDAHLLMSLPPRIERSPSPRQFGNMQQVSRVNKYSLSQPLQSCLVVVVLEFVLI